jgi:SAM-dependent methyltransferase
VTVPLKKGAESVKVVYTFWPNSYTRFIRTRTVKVEAGKTVKVSLMKAEKEVPDKIWVIYYPTPKEVVESMCKMGKVGKDDVVYDIGCGDGRMVIEAVKTFGAKKGVGIDLLEERIKECKANAKLAKVEDKVTFLQKDALTIKDYSEATVVLLYLSDPLNEALRPILQKSLKPGTRIVSHRFRMARDNYGSFQEYKLHLWKIK